MHPDLAVRVETRQAAQKQDHDTRGISERKFVEGDLVYVRDFRFPKKWIPGVIVTVTGPLSYTVKIGSGVVRRHIDHLRARHNSQVDASDDVYVDNLMTLHQVRQVPLWFHQVLRTKELFLLLIHLHLSLVFKFP